MRMQEANERVDTAKKIHDMRRKQCVPFCRKQSDVERAVGNVGKVEKTVGGQVCSITHRSIAVSHDDLENLETATSDSDECLRDCEEGREAGRRTV